MPLNRRQKPDASGCHARLNITREAELRQRLQASQKMAVVGEMMAYIAHEIRNPLMSIGRFASSLARQGDIPTRHAQKAGIIAKEATRLEGILNTIVRYSKPAELKVGSVDANRTVSEAVAIMSLGHNHQSPGIQLGLADPLPRVSADPDKLTQCLMNLIKNAHEVVNVTEGAIRIRTRYADAMVYLEVEDNGPGIPDSEQDTIFMPYMTTKPEGGGLGLPIVRKLVSEMGGRIFLHSKEGVGSLFSIALPPAVSLNEEDAAELRSALPTQAVEQRS